MASKSIILAAVPLLILGGVVYYLMGPGTSFLYTVQPLPNVTVENAEFRPGIIIAHIRNTGQEPVTIAQADINDRPWEARIKPGNVLPRLATADVLMKYPWTEGVPYEIGITTSDGTRFAYEVNAAMPTPELSGKQISYFAILGSYVGIIPVVIGLLWFPFMSRISTQWYNFFLSLTAGLLVFLAFDALQESFVTAGTLATAFEGQVLVPTVVIATFLAMLLFSYRGTVKTVESGAMQGRTVQFYGLALSYMIAIGIGLHNFGEGLAIGAAVALGAVALSKFLVIGFTIHNTTEGLAIIAPVAKQKARIMHLLALGLIAGAPTIAGTWIGGFTYMPVASVIFLAVGAGAIFQVVFAIFRWMNKSGSAVSSYTIAGFTAGMLLMYLTGLLVAV